MLKMAAEVERELKKRTLKVHPQGLESEGAFARIALF